MSKKRVKRLFYKDVSCEHCPLSVFDPKEDDWISDPNIEMLPGDHVVINGVEQVYLGDDNYRKLGAVDTPMWDEAGDPPEMLAVGIQIDEDHNDPYYRVEKKRHIVRHF